MDCGKVRELKCTSMKFFIWIIIFHALKFVIEFLSRTLCCFLELFVSIWILSMIIPTMRCGWHYKLLTWTHLCLNLRKDWNMLLLREEKTWGWDTLNMYITTCGPGIHKFQCTAMSRYSILAHFHGLLLGDIYIYIYIYVIVKLWPHVVYGIYLREREIVINHLATPHGLSDRSSV